MRYKTTNLLQLTNIVFKETQEKKLFNLQESLLVMFSGGQDSVCCLLVLFLLKKKEISVWNRKKLLDLSEQNKNKETLTKQKFNKTQISYEQISKLTTNNCTLLWCNHFWQSTSFFTMEHVSKLILCQRYSIHFFLPTRKVLKEQGARNWRHKVMQRLALHSCKEESRYRSIELYVNLVFFNYPLTITGRHTINLRDNPAESQLLSKSTQTRPTCVSPQESRQISGFNKVSQAECLCVQGHTKSDRAESILLNLIKGTGMNGISTLQWKHTFYSSTNSTNTFYPTSFDFFKEVRILHLQSSIIKRSEPKQTVRVNRDSLTIYSYLLSILLAKQRFIKRVKSSRKGSCIGLYVQAFSLPFGMNKVLCYKNQIKFRQSDLRKTKNATANVNQRLTSNLFSRGSHVKTFYYQLRYKMKRV